MLEMARSYLAFSINSNRPTNFKPTVTVYDHLDLCAANPKY